MFSNARHTGGSGGEGAAGARGGALICVLSRDTDGVRLYGMTIQTPELCTYEVHTYEITRKSSTGCTNSSAAI